MLGWQKHQPRNFNSNMVRLKAKIVALADLKHSQFQFQHGAIKRCIIDDYYNPSIAISIPTWCD